MRSQAICGRLCAFEIPSAPTLGSKKFFSLASQSFINPIYTPKWRDSDTNCKCVLGTIKSVIVLSLLRYPWPFPSYNFASIHFACWTYFESAKMGTFILAPTARQTRPCDHPRSSTSWWTSIEPAPTPDSDFLLSSYSTRLFTIKFCRFCRWRRI